MTCAAHRPVFKLLHRGNFEAFRPKERHIAPMWLKSTLPRQISPEHCVSIIQESIHLALE